MMTPEDLHKILFARKEREEKTIFVTDVSGCLRKAYFSYYKPAFPTPAQVLGSLLHFGLEKILKSKFGGFFEVSFALLIRDEWHLKGRCDMVHGNAVYEFKFVSDIEKARERGEYYLQLQFYIYAMRVEKGFLVLIDKNNFEIEFIEVGKDDYVAERLIEDAEYLAECIEKRTVPDRLSPRFANECEYCDYADECEYCDYNRKPRPSGRRWIERFISCFCLVSNWWLVWLG